MEPTEKQIKELWEWCEARCLKCGGLITTSIQPGLCCCSSYELDLDLNNLFMWAEHLFVSMACGSLNEENWKGAWAKVITQDRQGIGEIREEGLTPVLALFWAIDKVREREG